MKEKQWLIGMHILVLVSLLWVIWPVTQTSCTHSAPEQLSIIQPDSGLSLSWRWWAEWITTPPRPARRRWLRTLIRRLRRFRRAGPRVRPQVPSSTPALNQPPGPRRPLPESPVSGVIPLATATPAPPPVVEPTTEVVPSLPSGQALTPTPPTRRRGRKPTIDTRPYFCPEKTCVYYRKLGPGHRIVGNGHCGHGKRHQFLQCQACETEFCERRGTVFFNLKTPEHIVYRALKSLAEGQGIRSVARTFDVDVETVRRWLQRAAKHAALVSDYLMRNLNVPEAQLDELWTFVYKKEKNLSAWEKLYSEYGDTWIWVAFDPIHKLVVAFVVGDHEQAQAETLLRKFKARLAEGVVPYLTSDELAHYAAAILKVFGRWEQPERRGKRGPQPKPRPVPGPDLCYATVNKTRVKSRVVAIATRIVFGTAQAVWQRLKDSPVSRAINTAFVERMNLTFRLFNRRLTRKTLGFSKKQEWLEWHLHLTLAYYHFVRPHGSLRVRLAEPIPTRGNGSPKQWQPRTPAMAAGLMDHVWTMHELLTFRVPLAA